MCPQSNLAWAYAKLSHFSAELFEAIAAAASKQAHELNDQHISNLLWSVATLNGARASRRLTPPCAPWCWR